MPNTTKTMDELKEMAMEYCRLKQVQRDVESRLEPMKVEFDKMLNPGEAVQCDLGIVRKTKQGKAGFAYLTEDAKIEMETFKRMLVGKGMASDKHGNPFIECITNKVV